MLSSLALIFIVGLSAAGICKAIKLPRIIGMLAVGAVLGPYVLNLLDPSILGISSELRKMALVIILIKAGLSLNVRDLKEVGRPAILMSFLPAVFEMLGCMLIAPPLLGISLTESALVGAVLGAVSPAVVVPKMVQLIEQKLGTNKKIPQLILAGASLDDVFVIVLFSVFLGMNSGDGVSLIKFADIPISIITGVVGGILVGIILSLVFEWSYKHSRLIKNSMKVVLILGSAFSLVAFEDLVAKWFAFSGLIAVMSMACTVQLKSIKSVSERLSQKFGKIWIAAEVILFVLVGAAVDLRYTLSAGLPALFLILGALVFRSVGVAISLVKTNLNRKERLFCVIAYLPKATVQAAIGSVPLAMGLKCGNLALSVAVLSIVVTAPLGAFLMEITQNKLLDKE